MKIAVYLPATLGESFLSLPAVRTLQQNFPTAEICLLSSSRFAAFFQNILPGFEVIGLPDLKDIASLKRTSSRLQKMNFDLGLLLDESFASALLFYLARIPQRWGYDREGRGFMLTRKLRLKATDPRRHIKDHYLHLLQKLGLQVDEQPFFLKLPEKYIEAGGEHLKRAGLDPTRPAIAIKPGSSFGAARVWPVTRQEELIKKLLEKDLQVALIGSPSSQSISRTLKASADGRVADLAGSLSLEETAGVIASSKVYVGNDSGLTHLANFLGTPVVGLYGPTDPHLSGPSQAPSVALKKVVPCSPCSYRACPYDHRCLNSIEVEEVLDVILTFLPS